MKRFNLVLNTDGVFGSDIRPGKRRCSWQCTSRFEADGNNPIMDSRFEKLKDLISTGGGWNCSIHFTLSVYCSNGTDSETRGVTLDVDACVFSKLVHWMDLSKHPTGLAMGATVVANGRFVNDSQEEDLYHGKSVVSKEEEDSILSMNSDDLHVSLYVFLEEFPEDALYLQNRRLLEDGVFCDLELEFDDGQVLNCHKSIMSVNSSVISVALQETYLEGQTSRIKMDYSLNVGMALVKYLYYRNLDAAAESCSIALDLLRASDYYCINNLWNDVFVLFLRSEESWFDLSVLFETFDFIVKACSRHSNSDEMVKKLISVFVMKRKQVFSGQLYLEYLKQEDFRKAWFKYSLNFLSNTLL